MTTKSLSLSRAFRSVPSEWIAVVGIALFLLFLYSMRTVPSRTIHSPYHPYPWFGGGFEGFVGSPQTTFTMFGTSWCGHCKEAKPQFDALGPKVTNASGFGSVATRYVDVEQDKQATVGYTIDGYPTFYLDAGSTRIKYDGPRTTAGFRAFVQKNVGGGD